MGSPAAHLEGVTLNTGWIIDQKASRSPTGTGGSFSTGYLVHHPDGRKGFLKAMDYSVAFQSRDISKMIELLARAYNFEVDICLKCKEARINRVVHAIEHGTYQPPGDGPTAVFLKVEYLIFEKADGDIRHFLDQQSTFDIAFALRTLHGVSAALQQMHGASMAHQDVKPSNVLIFSTGEKQKLGDLGRAWAKGLVAPHDDYQVCGDPEYAPYELLFDVPLDEASRRFGVDFFMLGSLVVFMFTRVHMFALTQRHLHESLRGRDKLSTFEEILPYLQNAFSVALDEFSDHVPAILRRDLRSIVSELCDPDYRRRGNPPHSQIRRFSLERYTSSLNLLV